MSLDFDPYYMFLGISRKERPIDHYRLLGLDRFEANDEITAMAADRQMGHLQRYESGEHADHVAKLMNEVSRARICLLDPAKKTAYDEKLREQQRDPSLENSDKVTKLTPLAERGEDAKLREAKSPVSLNEATSGQHSLVEPTLRERTGIVEQDGEPRSESVPIVEPETDDERSFSRPEVFGKRTKSHKVDPTISESHPKTGPAAPVGGKRSPASPIPNTESSPSRQQVPIWLFALISSLVLIAAIVALVIANSGKETEQPTKPDKPGPRFTGSLDTGVEMPKSEPGKARHL